MDKKGERGRGRRGRGFGTPRPAPMVSPGPGGHAVAVFPEAAVLWPVKGTLPDLEYSGPVALALERVG